MRLTFKFLEAFVSAYVNPEKAGTTDFDITRTNLAGLVDKIGLIVTLDNDFYDPLSMLDGEELPLGKTVEEFYQDLIMPSDYDSTGANALAPNDPTYRKATYSVSLGRKKFKTTIRYNEYERACNSPSDLASLTTMVIKRLSDSETLYRFKLKKQGLGILAKKCIDANAPVKNFATSTPYAEREYIAKDSGKKIVGVVMKDIAGSNVKSWETLVNEGVIVETHLVTTIAKPTDTATGEAFVKQIKNDVETFKFATEGYSLNGGVIGAEKGLVLILKKGINSVLDVDVLAGAFNGDKLAIPAEMVVVDDFGNTAGTEDVYAILADKRMLRLHTDYRATREQPNADGDFVNLYRHSEYTLFISNNTLVKVYKSK